MSGVGFECFLTDNLEHSFFWAPVKSCIASGAGLGFECGFGLMADHRASNGQFPSSCCAETPPLLPAPSYAPAFTSLWVAVRNIH